LANPADGNTEPTAAVAASAAASAAEGAGDAGARTQPAREPQAPGMPQAPASLGRMEGTAGWDLWFGVLRGPVVIGVLFAIVIAVGSSFDIYVAGSIAIYGLASAGQGWLMGRAGQVSLGGGALFAVGAFAAAFTTQVHSLAAFPLPLIAAGLAGAVVGGIVAVPGLRFRGVYLLLATLALLYVVQFAGERLQQNVTYLAGVTMNPGPGATLLAAGRPATATAVVVLIIGLIVIERLYRTQAGREWASVKENEIASAAMGIRVRRRKVQAFVGSSAVTAVAGGLFAYYIGLVSYTAFDLNLTLQLVVMVFIGGAAAAIGPVVGAAIVTLLPYLLNDTVGHVVQASWYSQNGPFLEQIIYGLALALILLYARGGLAGLRTVVVRLARRRTGAHAERRDGPDAAPAPGPEAIAARAELPEVPAAPEATAAASPPAAAVSETAAAAGADPEPASEGVPAAAAKIPGQALLTVSSLSVRYAGVGVAVSGVSLEVRDGAILGILGRNGAGKSTLLKSIGGFPPRDRVRLGGIVRIGDTELSGRSPEYCTRHGVVLVPEQGKVFPALTVREHFALAGARGKAVTETLRKTGLTMLERRLDSYAASLSGGERQFLALSVAVLRQPRLLLVDEMSLGLAPIAVAEVGKAILRIRDTTGCAVILVEQNAPVAAAIADELAVLENGQVMWQGLPPDLPEHALETAYFGVGAGGDVVREAGL
jgi:ABC-type branched-subunit amino acid transport system ATPase component/ABC-type branched-subunit amino acid transport system permease subunit